MADRKNLHILVDSMKWILVELDVAIKNYFNHTTEFSDRKEGQICKQVYISMSVHQTHLSSRKLFINAGVSFLRNKW